MKNSGMRYKAIEEKNGIGSEKSVNQGLSDGVKRNMMKENEHGI